MPEVLNGRGEEGGLKAQAGKLLCVSETIFPDGSKHFEHLFSNGRKNKDVPAAPAPGEVRGSPEIFGMKGRRNGRRV